MNVKTLIEVLMDLHVSDNALALLDLDDEDDNLRGEIGDSLVDLQDWLIEHYRDYYDIYSTVKSEDDFTCENWTERQLLVSLLAYFGKRNPTLSQNKEYVELVKKVCSKVLTLFLVLLMEDKRNETK